jgi:predicted GH43/DUF377 family glycosyl hydrolase
MFSWLHTFLKRKKQSLHPLGIGVFGSVLCLVYRNRNGTIERHPAKEPRVFHRRKKTTMFFLDTEGAKETTTLCSNFRFSETDEHYIACYQRTSSKKIHTIMSTSEDGIIWRAQADTLPTNEPAIVIPIKGQRGIWAITSTPYEILILHKKSEDSTWEQNSTIEVTTQEFYFKNTPIQVVEARPMEEGILIVFDASYAHHGYQVLQLGAVMIAHDNPGYVHWMFHTPLWEQFIEKTKTPYTPMGTLVGDQDILVYYRAGDTVLGLSLPQHITRLCTHPQKTYLERPACNPLIEPDPKSHWSCVSTFNPASVTLDNRIYLLYRSEGATGLSRIGYAHSETGLSFETLPYPVYVPRMSFEGAGTDSVNYAPHYASGYAPRPPEDKTLVGWHGCEDPRTTSIDGRIYMTYAAFPGYGFATPAITSISVDDFLAHKWNWSTPQPMTTEPKTWGEGAKNIAIFPEKINGKYVVLYRVWPNICIDYVDSLDFGPGQKWLSAKAYIPTTGASWDNRKIAVGAPPIKVPSGWLIIYQGMGWQDHKGAYKIGAMIVDHENPSKVLYRSTHPILTPETWYENDGHKANVVFPCGAAVKDGFLHVYYGGSDKNTCVASANLNDFLEKLQKEPYKEPALIPITI